MNYIGTTRSNYFHVVDKDAFEALMSRVWGDYGTVQVWDNYTDNEGNQLFGFGCDGAIMGCIPPGADENDDEEPDYDEFLNGLQKCIAEDDCVIIIEGGHEGFRYVVGSAVCITRNNIEFLNITSLAIAKAQEMLGNPKWNTRVEY